MNESEKERGGAHAFPLPEPLAVLRIRRCIAGAGILLLAAVLSLTAGDIRIMLLSPAGLWLMWSGFSLEHDLGCGRIQEGVFTCTSVRPSHFKDAVILSFRDETGESPVYLTMRLNGRLHADEFAEGGRYICYFEPGQPSLLLAYTAC